LEKIALDGAVHFSRRMLLLPLNLLDIRVKATATTRASTRSRNKNKVAGLRELGWNGGKIVIATAKCTTAHHTTGCFLLLPLKLQAESS
jgi:hypothetical protein